MAINVGHPSNGRTGDVTHHIKLTDADSTEVGFICTDNLGRDFQTVAVNPYPQFASQLRQGQGRHSDRVPPFEDIPLSDFSGGMAMLHYDEDKTRYLDGMMVDTSEPGQVIHAGKPTYLTGIRDFDENWLGNLSWLSLYSGGTTSKTTSFSAGASYNVNSIIVILKKVGSPTGDVTVELLASDDSSLKSKALTIGTDCLTDLISERVEFVFSSVQAVTASTTYKVKVSYSGGSSASYVDVGIDGSSNLMYRVLDDTGSFNAKMFEYKNAFYVVTMPDDGSVSKLYIAGDRGAADDNSGDKSLLNDATKSWTADEWIGDIVVITSGDGMLEEQNWREITDNDANSLTVSPDWDNTHDTNTEYVILSDNCTLKQTLTAKVHDVAVVQDKVYFAFGYPGGSSASSGGNEDLFPRRYREYNDGGTWTEEITMEDNQHYGAERLVGLETTDESRHEITHADLFMGCVTPWGSFLSQYQVPYGSQDMFCVIGTLCENDRAWTDTVYSNSVPNPYYYGSVVNVGASFTTGKCAHWKLDAPLDIRGGEALAIRVNINPAGAGSSNYTDAGDIRLVLADSAGNEDEYNLDGTIEEWYSELLFLLDPGTANADMSDITDLYWKINSDEGQVIINLWGRILLVGDRGLPYKQWHAFQSGELINNILEYGGGAGEVQRKPWILTDRYAYYVEDDIIKPIYIKELQELKHPKSGLGAVVSGVYLYFNAGKTIQRYYAGQLDNIGPDVDYGLPEERIGYPVSMASYPGRVIAAIDAESNTSSVIYRRNHGWHEMYRGVDGEQIRSVHVFARADSADRVYISEGADILWVPISINPKTDADYEYNYEAVLETSRIYAGLRETEKYFHAVTIISENLSSTNRYIEVDYRTSESSTWTNISTAFNTSPRQRQSLTSNNDTVGRWIQFRFRSYTDDRAETPEIVAVVIDALERLDSNRTFTYVVKIKEGIDIDLAGQEEALTGNEKFDQLETWIDDPKPLTLNTNTPYEDDTLVFIEPMKSQVRYSKPDDQGQNVRLLHLTLIEVE